MRIRRRVIFAVIGGILIFIMVAIALFLLLSQDHSSFYLNNGQLSKLIKLGEKGDGEACWALSFYYEEDEEKSLYWMKKGASYGNATSLYDLAYYLRDQYGKEATEEFANLLTKAAKQNYVPAQEALAKHYKQYPVGKTDMVEYWLREASKNGSTFAMLDLSKLLITQPNYEALVAAYRWVSIILLRVEAGSEIDLQARKHCDQIVYIAKRHGCKIDELKRDATAKLSNEERNIPRTDPIIRRKILMESISKKLRED